MRRCASRNRSPNCQDTRRRSDEDELCGRVVLHQERPACDTITQIDDDVATQPFQLVETTKRVRDRCRAAGESISRVDVNFALQRLLFSGHEFGKGQDTPTLLARRSTDNALGLCGREQMVIDDAATNTVNRWLC